MHIKLDGVEINNINLPQNLYIQNVIKCISNEMLRNMKSYTKYI